MAASEEGEDYVRLVVKSLAKNRERRSGEAPW
jgi:hypothetical protein